MSKVSVWLTSYNHGEFLRDSIESVINQTYQDYELIIVDDCSTDNSQEIIKRYAEGNPKIKIILHEKNLGYSGLRDGMDIIEGEYLAILHGDDVWEKEKLEEQVNILDERKDVIACFTGVRIIDSKGQAYKESHSYSQAFKMENRTRYEWLRYFFDNGNCLCHPSLLIRTSAYKQYDLFSSGLHSLPDFYKWIKLCFYENIYIIPKQLMLFRIHDDESNASGDTAEKQKRLFVEEYFLYQQYFNISDIDTLLKVFPESEKYIKDGKCVVEFVLAKMFLEAPRDAQKLIGLNCIYELFQDKEKKNEIAELYGYGEKEFNLDKQKYDIFGNIPRERYLITTLFIDTGEGYSEENSIKKTVYIPNTGIARVCYDISNFGELQGLRFDIDEGVWRRCKVLKAEWGSGEKVYLESINGEKRDDEDFFYTVDPQYNIEVKDEKSLEIVFRVDTISSKDVEKYYKMHIEKMKQMIDQPKKNRMRRLKRFIK